MKFIKQNKKKLFKDARICLGNWLYKKKLITKPKFEGG